MAKLIPLSNWLNETPDHVVSLQMAQPESVTDFKHRVQKWHELLARHEGLRWAVYHSDTSEFIAILLALWQLDKTACVPGDNCNGTVARLTNYVDGFIGEFPSGLNVDDFKSSADEVMQQQWKIVQPNFIALEIYTSGSTGEPKPISKTIFQLDQEIASLESQWPSQQDCVVLTTVSHQHLYGMTFGLLWPFSAGQAITRKVCDYSEDIFHHAKHYLNFSLISSPSHLARMNTAVNWDELKSKCMYVISSAAPLSKQDSLAVGQLLKTEVREIYGSSETGAIASRIQLENENNVSWEPLPRVELSTDNNDVLRVKSPYLLDNNALQLSDRVKFYQDGTFALLGRVDNIVKVEGKRISLTAIENAILNNSWVQAVKALTLNRKRVEMAAVIQLTELGAQQLKELGRKAVISSIKASLIGSFERVVLPRRWRFVEHMPYNPQGKLPMDTLQKLFEKEPVKWPKVDRTVVDSTEATIECHIPAELIYFDGHFDNNPILPGVTQVYWVEKYGRELLNIAGRFKRLEAIKFLQIISPNSRVTINLKYNQTNQSLTFQYQSEKGVHSTGRICFE